MKKCKKCEEFLPLSAFSKSARNKDGKQQECKQCRSEIKKQWRKDNPELWKARERNRFLRHKYGIDTERYNEILEEQGNKCAILPLIIVIILIKLEGYYVVPVTQE